MPTSVDAVLIEITAEEATKYLGNGQTIYAETERIGSTYVLRHVNRAGEAVTIVTEGGQYFLMIATTIHSLISP
jgi:hypothetical protein